MALVDNDPVTAWTEKATGLDFTQGTGANQPIFKTSIVNGHAVVRFDGVDDHLDADGSFTLNVDMVGDTGNTSIAVITGHDNLDPFGSIYSSDASSDRGLNFEVEGSGNGGVYHILPTTTGSRFIRRSSLPEGRIEHLPKVILAIYDGGTARHDVYVNGALVNGSQVGTAVPASLGGNGGPAGGFNIGTSDFFTDYFTGDIAEIAVFRRAITAVEQAAAEADLLHKYVDPMDAAIDLPGQRVWLKSDDLQFRPFDNDDNIAEWKGRFPNQQLAFAQSTGSDQPVVRLAGPKGLGIIFFDGVSDKMGGGSYLSDAAGLTGMTFFAVIRPADTAGTEAVIARNISGSRAFQFGTDGGAVNLEIATGTGTSVTVTGSTTLSTADFQVLTGRYDGGTTTGEVWLNGVSDGSSGSFPATIGGSGGGDIAIGARDPSGGSEFDGELAEVLVYDTNLTDPQRTAIETYLTDKWITPIADAPGGISDGLRFWIRAEDL